MSDTGLFINYDISTQTRLVRQGSDANSAVHGLSGEGSGSAAAGPSTGEHGATPAVGEVWQLGPEIQIDDEDEEHENVDQDLNPEVGGAVVPWANFFPQDQDRVEEPNATLIEITPDVLQEHWEREFEEGMRSWLVSSARGGKKAEKRTGYWSSLNESVLFRLLHEHPRSRVSVISAVRFLSS